MIYILNITEINKLSKLCDLIYLELSADNILFMVYPKLKYNCYKLCLHNTERIISNRKNII